MPWAIGLPRVTKLLRLIHHTVQRTLPADKEFMVRKYPDDGIPCGKSRVARRMKEIDLARAARRKVCQTRLSRHAARYPDKHLGGNFRSDDTSLKWVNGISYEFTQAGWLVLSVITDLYSRKIARWSFRSRMDSHITTRPWP